MKTIFLVMAAFGAYTAQIDTAQRPDATTKRQVPLLRFTEFETLVAGPLGFTESYRWNHTYDVLYVAPLPEDLERMFEYIQKFKWTKKYRDNAWDCDDLAREATYLAKRWGMDFYDGVPASVAFGSAYVRLDGQLTGLYNTPWPVHSYHVLNFYMDSENHVWFFEPLNGRRARVESFIRDGKIKILKLEW